MGSLLVVRGRRGITSRGGDTLILKLVLMLKLVLVLILIVMLG